MSDGTPTQTNPPANEPTEEQRFETWFQNFLKRHEPDNPANQQSQPVSGSQSQSSGQGFSLESAVEAILNRRDQRQRQTQRVSELETKNTDLETRIKSLEEGAKKVKRDIFSIFG